MHNYSGLKCKIWSMNERQKVLFGLDGGSSRVHKKILSLK